MNISKTITAALIGTTIALASASAMAGVSTIGFDWHNMNQNTLTIANNQIHTQTRTTESGFAAVKTRNPKASTSEPVIAHIDSLPIGGAADGAVASLSLRYQTLDNGKQLVSITKDNNPNITCDVDGGDPIPTDVNMWDGQIASLECQPTK